MPTPSPLATLIATLANVCQQARQHQPLLSKNEAATRAALIDPVLRALGWDTSDVAMVEPERTVENKQSLDYVLKTAAGGILAVIEAKKLGEPLDKLGHVGALTRLRLFTEAHLIFHHRRAELAWLLAGPLTLRAGGYASAERGNAAANGAATASAAGCGARRVRAGRAGAGA